MGGGDSREKKNALNQEAALSQQTADIARSMNARQDDQYKQIQPYAFDRLKNGLPFYGALTDFSSGTNAQAYAPAKANLMRMINRNGSVMPSGYKDQMLADFEGDRARGFDQQLINNALLNEQAKSEAARLVTGQQTLASPLPYYQAAMGGNQVIASTSAPKAGIGGILGGLAGGAMSALPF